MKVCEDESASRDKIGMEVDGMNILLWLILFVLCWPVALLALFLYPLIWLLLLPFRLLGITVDAVFQLIRALITLPARILSGARR